MPDIGATLRETRMGRRLDITEVEAATKIRAKYLRALENEEWDLLPGPTFVRTFLRTYGDYLELDSRMLVEEYKQRFERPTPQDLLPFGSGSGSGSGRRRPPRGGRGIPPFALVGVVVLLLVGALFALGKLGGSGDGGGASSTATATPTPRATPSGRSAQARKRARARARRRAAAARIVRLKIIPTGPVNVCLVSATGRRLIDSQTLAAGDTTRTFESKRLRVTFGNSSVRMRVGSRTVRVPPSSSPIGYDLRAGKAPRRLSAASQPSCS